MRFRFTHAEVIEHLSGRVQRETERIELIDQEVESISKLQDERESVMISKSEHQDPLTALKQRRRGYEKEREKWMLFRDHLIGNEDDPESLDLEHDDMELLGLSRSRYE